MGNFTVSGVHLMIAFSPFLVVTGAAEAPSIWKKVCPIRKFLPFFYFPPLIFGAFRGSDVLGCSFMMLNSTYEYPWLESGVGNGFRNH